MPNEAEETYEEEYDDSLFDLDDTIEIEGLDPDYSDEEDEDVETEEGSEDEEGEEEGEERPDADRRYTERLEREIDSLRGSVQQMQTAQQQGTAVEKEQTTKEIAEEIVKQFEGDRDALKESSPDNMLDTEQERAYAHQIGQHLVPSIVEYMEKKYGETLRGIAVSEQQRRVQSWDSSFKRAENRFFKDNPEVKDNKELLGKLNDRAIRDPRWKQLQMLPDEDALYDLFEEKYSPFALKALREAKSDEGKTKKRTKRKAEAAERTRLGSDTGNTVGESRQKKPRNMRESIERDLRRELPKGVVRQR